MCLQPPGKARANATQLYRLLPGPGAQHSRPQLCTCGPEWTEGDKFLDYCHLQSRAAVTELTAPPKNGKTWV